MDALLSMLVDLSRTFLHDVSDIPELSHINTKLEKALNDVMLDENAKSLINDIIHEYYSAIMTLYSHYPQSTFLDTLMHRIESLIQIANTLDGKQ